MSVGSIGSQVPWIRMSSPGPAARVSPVRAITGHLTSECTLHPRCPGLPSLPHRLISPEPLPTRQATPQLPGADIRQALGERSSICQCIDKEGCFIHGLARAFSHICFYVYFYPELSFLSLGETYILHFVFTFSILTFPPLRTLGKGILHPRRFPPPC